MKFNLQILAVMARPTEPECRRCLQRVLGNGLSQGALVSYETGDVTDRSAPDARPATTEIEGLVVIEADSSEAARFILAEVASNGVKAGEIEAFETSADITTVDEDDQESLDEVPQS